MLAPPPHQLTSSYWNAFLCYVSAVRLLQEISSQLSVTLFFQTVSDRTKEMLFAGAKKVTFARRLSVDIDPPPKPLPGQLRLDVGGHVCNKQVVPMDGGFGGGVNGGDFRCGKV